MSKSFFKDSELEGGDIMMCTEVGKLRARKNMATVGVEEKGEETQYLCKKRKISRFTD